MGHLQNESRDQGAGKIAKDFTSEQFADHAHSLLASLQRIAAMKGETVLARLLEPAKQECIAIRSKASGQAPIPS